MKYHCKRHDQEKARNSYVRPRWHKSVQIERCFSWRCTTTSMIDYDYKNQYGLAKTNLLKELNGVQDGLRVIQGYPRIITH